MQPRPCTGVPANAFNSARASAACADGSTMAVGRVGAAHFVPAAERRVRHPGEVGSRMGCRCRCRWRWCSRRRHRRAARPARAGPGAEPVRAVEPGGCRLGIGLSEDCCPRQSRRCFIDVLSGRLLQRVLVARGLAQVLGGAVSAGRSWRVGWRRPKSGPMPLSPSRSLGGGSRPVGGSRCRTWQTKSV